MVKLSAPDGYSYLSADHHHIGNVIYTPDSRADTFSLMTTEEAESLYEPTPAMVEEEEEGDTENG